MKNKLAVFWYVCLFSFALLLIILTFFNLGSNSFFKDQHWMIQSLVLMVLAFLSEYIDSSLGMGYGTTLTPLLVILGFPLLLVVPAVLFSEFITGILAAIIHHGLGNVDFRKGTRDRKIVHVLALCSVVGAIISSFLFISISVIFLKSYIAIMILGMGIFTLLRGRIKLRFSWKKIIGLGTLAAFNKGLSGGGYGPLLTGGQIVSGISGKNAIGITSLSEGITCLCSLIIYFIFVGTFSWVIAIPLCVGAVSSVPLASLTVKYLPEEVLTKYVGYAMLFLSMLMFLKMVL